MGTSGTSTLASSTSPSVDGSYSSLNAAVVTFVSVAPPWSASTVPTSVNVAVAPSANVPIVQIPVTAS